MTVVLVDTSVVVKWFHEEGEREVFEARRLLDAHIDGVLDVHIIDLGIYEFANVLVRALGWDAIDVADQLQDLLMMVGPPLAPELPWLRAAAELAVSEELTFHDAVWAASAQALGIALVSADRQLVESGLAESPSGMVSRLGIGGRD